MCLLSPQLNSICVDEVFVDACRLDKEEDDKRLRSAGADMSPHPGNKDVQEKWSPNVTGGK